jgi:hypothetical protein
MIGADSGVYYFGESIDRDSDHDPVTPKRLIASDITSGTNMVALVVGGDYAPLYAIDDQGNLYILWSLDVRCYYATADDEANWNPTCYYDRYDDEGTSNPVNLSALSGFPLGIPVGTQVVSINSGGAASGQRTAVVTDDGVVYVSGVNDNELQYGQTLFNEIEMPSGVTAVAASVAVAHVLIVGSDGNLYYVYPGWDDSNYDYTAHLVERKNDLITAGNFVSVAQSGDSEDIYVVNESGKIYSLGRLDDDDHTIADDQGVDITALFDLDLVMPVSVSIGGAPCDDFAVNASGLPITCTTTAHAAGTVDVVITLGNGEIVTIPDGYTYDDLFLTLNTDDGGADDNAATVADPAVNSGLGTTSTDVNITTNAPHGYSLYARADRTPATDDGAAGDDRLTCAATTSYFAPLATPGAIPAGQWGWKFGDTTTPTTWATPVLTDTLLTTTANASGTANDGALADTAKMWFGARAATTMPSCTYQTTVVYTVIANP